MARYRFVREAADYSDYASGAVLHSAVGRPAFPVRLASELFQRAYALWPGAAESRRCVLHDPCCGAGSLLAVTALLHGEAIRTVAGSDRDPEALRIAERNLALLAPAGMRARIETLAGHASRFGKASHRSALESAGRLLRRVEELSAAGSPDPLLFHADVFDGGRLLAGLGGRRVDVVLTDTPYGTATRWAAPESAEPGENVARMLASLRPALADEAIVVAVAPRGARAEAPDYRRVQRFRIGRREALFWRAG